MKIIKVKLTSGQPPSTSQFAKCHQIDIFYSDGIRGKEERGLVMEEWWNGKQYWAFFLPLWSSCWLMMWFPFWSHLTVRWPPPPPDVAVLHRRTREFPAEDWTSLLLLPEMTTSGSPRGTLRTENKRWMSIFMVLSLTGQSFVRSRLRLNICQTCIESLDALSEWWCGLFVVSLPVLWEAINIRTVVQWAPQIYGTATTSTGRITSDCR